jgi:Zn-finger nucleic acid-binding protein
MLIACEACHRQYDVGDFTPGTRVRCACGQLNVVPRPRGRQVEMLHCSNCGGRLRAGSTVCEYCSAEVRLGDRGLGPACPECFANTLVGAKHCGACGVRLEPEAVTRALSDRRCPRCKAPLSECEAGATRYVECGRCGGLWLDEAVFERVAREKDSALATEIRTRANAARAPLEKDVRYLPCPVCGQLMNRRNFANASGVILDWCRGHGWWFDAEELERVLAFVEAGGVERAREARHQRELQELRSAGERAARHFEPRPLPHRRPRNLLEVLVDLLLDF